MFARTKVRKNKSPRICPEYFLSPRRKCGAGSVPRSKAGLSVSAFHASEIAM